MTTVSLNFRQSAFAQETGAFPICLLTLSHPSLDAPIRISTDPTVRLEGRPTKAWEFDTGAEGWAASDSGGSVSVADGILTFTSGATNSYMNRTLAAGERFNGVDGQVIRARIRRTANAGGPWAGRIYYETQDHIVLNDHYVQIPAPANLDEWNVLEWDMSHLTPLPDSTDWVDNEIRRFRIDIVGSGGPGGDEFEVDWVRIYRSSADAEREVSALDVVYGTVIRNTEYIYLPMTLKLPDDTDDGAGEMTIELDNIHRAYTSAIRSIHDPIECHVEIVMSNDLNTVEAQWPAFLLTNVRYDAHVISATLKQETLEGEPFPALTFSPAYFRGMF